MMNFVYSLQSNSSLSAISTAQNKLTETLNSTQTDLGYGTDTLKKLKNDVDQSEINSKDINDLVTGESDVSFYQFNYSFINELFLS